MIRAALVACLMASWTGAAAAPPLSVRAWVSTAGPYGEMWEFDVPPEGGVRLHVLYLASPSGSVLGEWTASPQAAAALRATVERQRFFELPEKIAPASVPIHAPQWRLTVTLGAAQRSVDVLDPAQLGDDPRLSRFRAVWDAALAMSPLRPAWPAAKP